MRFGPSCNLWHPVPRGRKHRWVSAFSPSLPSPPLCSGGPEGEPMVWYSPLLREDSLTPFPRRSGRSLTSAKVAHRRQRRNHVLVAAPATGRTQPGQACGGMDSETDAPILIPPERPRSPTRPSQSEYRGDDTNGVPIASSCPRCLLQVIAAAPNHRPRLRALAVVRGPRAPVTNSPTSTDTAAAAVRGGAAAPSASPSTHSPAPLRI